MGHYYNRNCELIETDLRSKQTKEQLRNGDLVPGVTGIINEIANQGLEQWKQQQLIMSALTLPRAEGESLDDFAKRIIADSKEEGKRAAERGWTYHNLIYRIMRNEVIDYSEYPDMSELCEKIRKWKFQDEVEMIFNEQILVNTYYRFGSAIDMFCQIKDKFILLDIKTIARDADPYDSWIIQLAAYRLLMSYYNNFGRVIGLVKDKIAITRTFLDDIEYGNLIVNIADKSIVIKIYDKDELHRAEKMFLAALTIWKAKRKL